MSQIVATHHTNVKCSKTIILVGVLPLKATQIVLEMTLFIQKTAQFYLKLIVAAHHTDTRRMKTAIKVGVLSLKTTLIVALEKNVL